LEVETYKEGTKYTFSTIYKHCFTQKRINHLQEELRMSLTRKTSDVKEINVGEHQRRIAELRKELELLK
jgi:hypothetical protein